MLTMLSATADQIWALRLLASSLRLLAWHRYQCFVHRTACLSGSLAKSIHELSICAQSTMNTGQTKVLTSVQSLSDVSDLRAAL